MTTKITFLLCILLVILAPYANAQKYIISTVAGNGVGHGGGGGSFTGDGGMATNAGLAEPSSVAVDDTGNLYISDEINNRIRKVDKNGIITTFAGSDTSWKLNDGHEAIHAGLSEPWGVAWDTKNGLYISDWNDRRIRLVDKSGIIHTVAGKGTYGYTGDGGPADSATMSNPYGIIADKWHNVYFADAFNNVIRKIDTNGIITTFAGNSIKGYTGDGGQATDAELNTPLGIATDTFGNVFISNFQAVRKVDKSGIITTWIGNGSVGHTGDGGLATNATIGDPFDCAIDDSGNIYFTEYFYNYVRKVYANDTIISIAGDDVQGYNNYEGLPDTAKMWFPLGDIIDHSGNVFFADETNQIVRELSPCTAPVTISPAAPTICRGVSVALTAKGFNTYSWSPGSSLKDSTGYTVIATPTVTTTYIVSGTTCRGSDTVVVTVNTNKVPVLKITPNADTLCAGQSVTLTVSGSTGYQWSPGWEVNNSTNATVTSTPTATTTFVVMESTCMATDTAIVTVNPVPGTYIYTYNYPPDICAGQSITIYEGGANDYLWTPLTNLDTTSLDSVIANPTVTTTYTVIGTANGCQSPPQSIVIGVQAIPVVSINPSSPGLCTGSFSTIIANGAASYLWGPAAGLSDTTGDTIIANPSLTTTYIVTGTTSGCVSTPDTFVVAVDTMPVISVNPTSAGFCQGSNAILTASGAPLYLWSPATGLSTTTGDTVIAGPTSTITYTVTGFNPGCSSLPDTVAVIVSPAPNQPTVTKSVTGDTLFSSAKNGNQWYKNDTIITGATDSILVITGSPVGSYKVVVTNVANGCSSASDELVISGISQLALNNNELSLYPNPTTGEVTISSSKRIEEIKITNVLGQLIYESQPHQSKFTFELCNAGLYFVAVTSDNETATRKVIVSK